MRNLSNKSKYLLFIGIGFELIGIQIGLILLGTWLAGIFEWPKAPLIAGGIVLGLVVWLAHIVRALRQISEKTDKE